MIIRKYLHSCVSLEQEQTGKRLLIDPGAFCFIEGKQKPSDLPSVDVVLYTHKHRDHFDLSVLKDIIAKNPNVQIITNASVGAEMEKAGIQFTLVKNKEEINVAGFTIEPINAPHESIPAEVPENTAYFINHLVLHPGDSIDSSLFKVKCKLLFLPVAGPWLTLNQSLALAANIRPVVVIPIHDTVLKDFMLERVYEMSGNFLMNCKVTFKPLSLGEQFQF